MAGLPMLPNHNVKPAVTNTTAAIPYTSSIRERRSSSLRVSVLFSNKYSDTNVPTIAKMLMKCRYRKIISVDIQYSLDNTIEFIAHLNHLNNALTS